LKTLKPHEIETWLYFNQELCEFAFSFPVIVEPKTKDMFKQRDQNPINWPNICTIPESAVYDMEQSLGVPFRGKR
jgi:hypothetical protein